MKGVGVKKAYKYIKTYGDVFKTLKTLKVDLDMELIEKVKKFYLNPPVTDEYEVKFKEPKEDKILEFLCEEHDFSRSRVEKAIEKLKSITSSQLTLERWF